MTDIGKIIAQLEHERAAIERALTALREIGGGKTPTTNGRKGRRRRGRLSPEGRRKIAEAARRRWAQKRAAEAKKSATKK